MFVIDTNVVVAGLLTGDSDSPPVRILDGMLAARFPFLLSPELLTEYRVVLLRKPVRKRHRLQEREVDVILTEIAANSVFREPQGTAPRQAPKADPGDRHLIRLLGISLGSSLVTGDRKLQQALRRFFAVYTPAEFVELKSL